MAEAAVRGVLGHRRLEERQRLGPRPAPEMEEGLAQPAGPRMAGDQGL